MRENEVMEQLAALGTEQTRKTYARHGATGSSFGVLYSDLGKLQKRYGTDQSLAEALWTTGNHDARVLATMMADPVVTEATAMLNELYEGGEVEPERMRRVIGLFRVDFRDPIVLRPELSGSPVFLGLAMAPDNTLRMKPQNLLMNLPLASRS